MTRTPDPDVPQRVRKRRELRDATIIAGIAEATAIWGMALDTVYLAQKFNRSESWMLATLKRLERKGRLLCISGGCYGNCWRVKENDA